MIRSEIIQMAVERIGIEEPSADDDAAHSMHIEDYLDNVIANLAQQLPDGEILTCEDFKHLGVACCDASHHSYCPHVDMQLVILTDGSKAWVCGSLRTALLALDVATTTNVKVAANKAASIIASAEALNSHDAGQRAYDLLHLDREMTTEESVEFCAIMRMPTKFYVE
jgi:hypothetical protein